MPQQTVDAQAAAQKRGQTEDLNQRLASMAVQNSADSEVLQEEYAIGTGDVLDVSVFDVPELNTTVRVGRRGTILLPLVGEVEVGGKSLGEVEDVLVERLTEFMHDPQVSVFMAEFNSQQVSVTGAVNTPALHTLTRPRTVMEVLSMSGGLTEQAGNQIYLRTVIDNEPQRIIIDLDEVLFNPENDDFKILVSGGDTVYVPEAGTVFVEGAVNNPGAYPLEGKTGIVEAIAMAGGAKFEAQQAQVRIVTVGDAGSREFVSVDLDKVRANEAPNVSLNDGDIVLVPTSKAKAGWAGFWRGFTGIFGVGYGLNGP